MKQAVSFINRGWCQVFGRPFSLSGFKKKIPHLSVFIAGKRESNNSNGGWESRQKLTYLKKGV